MQVQDTGSDRNRIKKTIRDLLNLSDNDAAFEQEAASALRFARRLMMRHHIDQSDLEQLRDSDEVAAAADVEYGEKTCYSETSGLSRWERQLNNVLCKLIGTINWYYRTGCYRRTRHGAHIYNDKGTRERAARMTFYGPVEDCADALDLVDEWRQVIIAMARLKFGGVFRGPGRSYCEGFVRSLLIQVNRIRHRESAESLPDAADQSTALMIRNSTAIMKAKKDKGKEWLKNAGVKLSGSPNPSSAAHHSTAYKQGLKDGRHTNLSRSTKKRLA